jgi:1-deoxy-D-xylulose-5-phosphate reductoisomerase
VRKIAILGSTGSIGRQALDVIRNNPDRFDLEILTAQSSADLLVRQALDFQPNAVVIGNEDLYISVKEKLIGQDIKVFAGQPAIEQVVEFEGIDVVLNALVGYAGFRPTVAAIKAGKTIALANKESLVVGGELVSQLVKQYGASVIPVDSEHSAIFQCLLGEDPGSVSRLYLTASGGPFRNYRLEELGNVTREDALNHPNWDMGDKITVDSASMMNKGLEVIEAHWLFGVQPDDIKVVIHPQSVVHSLVEFNDGSLKAQLGLPDMRIPIQFALAFPERLVNEFPRFDFLDYPDLTFYQPDTTIFRNLALAFQALKTGGNAGCILNAANEEAVCAFLAGRIGFMDMPGVIEKCLDTIQLNNKPEMDVYEQTDAETRKLARHLINAFDHNN